MSSIMNFSLPVTDPVTQFLLILIIILIIPIIFNKIKIPSLLGLIIAGIAIGPLGLNIMAKDASFDLFGTAGLLFIMFLAGLDTDMTEFKKNSAKSAVFGVSTFLFPFLLSAAVSYFLLDLSLISSVLVGAMIAPHTPIMYPIVTKFDVQKNIAVSVTLGGTLITNIVSFVIIIVVVGMSTGDVNQSFWVQLSISVVIFAAIMAFLFPLAARFFFKKFQDNILQFIFVLVMLFLGAFVAEVAGIEKIIGALFAGMALSRLIPRTSPLMNRIQFVGNSIFIPFFLISVGMLVDLRAFVKDFQTIKVAIFLTAIALISKYLAAWITQKWLGFSVDQRRIINGLSTAQAAATLAVVMVGYKLEMLNDAFLSGTLIMILVTCTVAALQTQTGSKNIAQQKVSVPDAESDNKSSEEERILISVSNFETVEDLVNLSTMIKSQSSKQELYALNIINSNRSTASDDQNATKILDIASEVASATDNSIHRLMRYDVNIINGITNVIKENHITDLVLGVYKKKGISSAFIGSLNEGILAKSNSTTFIYKAAQPIATIKSHRIFVPEGGEKELGFSSWLLKLTNIALNSGTKLIFYSSEKTLSYIREFQKKHTIDCEFVEFTDWDDFLILSRDFGKDDNLIFVLSRKVGLSYHRYMCKVPDYLNKYFQQNSFILIFPMQLGISISHITEEVEAISRH
ncbi:MAG: cation:proton antiporter [Proteobacteria bacterium]|nr:cation:proton antiporter [Pseudomonadota bacterium]